jgi:hypothetical protein
VLLLDNVWRNHRMIIGLHSMPDFENLFLNAVQFAGRQSCRWQHGLPLILPNADKDIAAAQIMKIVGESAHRVKDGLGIPALLKLQPFPLHGLPVQDVFNIDRQVHCRTSINQNRLRENQIVPRRTTVRYPRYFSFFFAAFEGCSGDFWLITLWQAGQRNLFFATDSNRSPESCSETDG